MPNVTVYVMTSWQNLPSKNTALEATNLNHIEQGIKTVTDFINTLNIESGKVLCQVAFTNTLKSKLDGIEDNANNYVLPTASSSTKGGVKVDGTTIVIDQNGVISAAASATELSELTDVDLESLANGQILVYDSTSQKWVNTNLTVTTTLDSLTDVDIDNLVDGQGLIWDSTAQKWENGNVASAVSALTDVLLNNLTDGQVLIWNATLQRWVNSSGGGSSAILNYNDTITILNQ